MNTGPAIRVDNHEPSDIAMFLSHSHQVSVEHLNEAGLADYVWYGADGLTSNLERKTWQDIASKGDEVEEQLMRHIKGQPTMANRLLIEGACEPSPNGVYVYSRARGRNAMNAFEITGHSLYKRVMGLVVGWAEYMPVYFTASYSGTAGFLAELYDRDQKPEDEKRTFRRYFKHIDWRGNVMVSRLLGLAQNDSNIGPTKAEALIDEFGSVWYAIHQEPRDWAKVPGIGEKTAREFLRRIGRPDV